VRPHVHARTVRGASRALAMAIAFGFSRRDRGVLVRNSRIRGSPREPSPEVITMWGGAARFGSGGPQARSAPTVPLALAKWTGNPVAQRYWLSPSDPPT
jgi:hypothetical protein